MGSYEPQATQNVGMLLAQFCTLHRWSESRRLVEDHPELLDKSVIALLGQMIETAEQKPGQRASYVRDHYALLLRIREVGIEEAFRPLIPDFKLLEPPEVQPMPIQALHAEERYDQTGHEIHLDVAIAAWEYVLADPRLGYAPVTVLSAACNDAGGAYLKRYMAGRAPADLDAALRLLELAVRTAPAKSKSRAKSKHNLAAARRLMKHS